jgi:hypothetical protein
VLPRGSASESAAASPPAAVGGAGAPAGADDGAENCDRGRTVKPPPPSSRIMRSTAPLRDNYFRERELLGGDGAYISPFMDGTAAGWF